MTNTRGSKSIIVDSDALIGIVHEDDLLHERCLKIAKYLTQNNFTSINPYPIVLEAATTLAKDKTIRRSDLALQLLKDYAEVKEAGINWNVSGFSSKFL
jgi:predicted nucleic acid-binding protein